MPDRGSKPGAANRGRVWRVRGAPRVAALALAWLLVVVVPITALGQPGPLRGNGHGAATEPTLAPRPESHVAASDANASDAPLDLAGRAVDQADQTARGAEVRRSPTRRDETRSDEAPAANRATARQSSVRPRRDPAPVDLGGAVATERRPPARPANPAGTRVWPMRPGTFEFSQAYGCVPQIGGYYRVDPGCPGDAPSVHTGIDLAARQGTRIYAAASGWVREAGLDRPSGLANTLILIQHDGRNDRYATEYYHWITTYVEPGQYIRAGQPIAEVGSVGYSTGPHLHFGVVDFETGERIDPMRWLPREGGAGGYQGIAPGSVAVTFDDVSVAVPDYADPAPPPVPRRERLPDPPPDAEPAAPREAGDRGDRAAPAAAPNEAAEADREDDGGGRAAVGDDRDRGGREDRGRDRGERGTSGNGGGGGDNPRDERGDRDGEGDDREGERHGSGGGSAGREEPADDEGTSTAAVGPPPVPAVPTLPTARSPGADADGDDVKQNRKDGRKSR